MPSESLQQIRDYHVESKHRLERYAPGPDGLDWASQPSPFRVYRGAPTVDLPLQADDAVRFRLVRAGERPRPARVDLGTLGALLEMALGLSAWKSFGGSRWALRCNPSSGNLHPTECYVATRGHAGLGAGVYHYRSDHHVLARRASLSERPVSRAPSPGLIVALTSVHWREAWKYGLRAYRYCQLDVGHALAALSYAAAALGWRCEPLPFADAALSRLLGVDRESDFEADEGEAVGMALWIGPGSLDPDLLQSIEQTPWSYHGKAEALSAFHALRWPEIDQVDHACARSLVGIERRAFVSLPPLIAGDCDLGAGALIRQRRSAVAFDGRTSLDLARWVAMLDAVLPRRDLPPWDVLPAHSRVHLLLFVHRIRALDPGLYLLARDPVAIGGLKASMRADWMWRPVEEAPDHMALFCLAEGDTRALARSISCHQDIASDGCFAVAMLGALETVLASGGWGYRELFWECGQIGQVLYLEAEAAGLRGTGIGCFFDDSLHDLLGIGDMAWQSLYHFTVGFPVEDSRLQTHPPYAHLNGRRA